MWITPQVQEILHRPAPHKDFGFKVSEAEDGVFIGISIDELSNYSHGQREDLSQWIAGIVTDIRKLSVPCYITEWKRS